VVPKKPSGEEMRRRIPRLTMSLVMAIIFFIIGLVVPPLFSNVELPGLSINADFVFSNVELPGLSINADFVAASIIMLFTAIFLVRALADAVALADIVTDIAVKRLGITEERPPRRAARDLLYVVVIILVVTALSPVLVTLGNIGELLTTITTLVALALIVILIYDMGRILYRIIEERAESVADRLAEMAERDK